jgi:hypothetical protein
MLVVFPQNVRWGGLLNNAAENTIHLNHRQFHRGFGRGDYLKPGFGRRQNKWQMTEMSKDVCDE